MLQIGEYIFKPAESPEEFEQIHSLNYRSFVSEIPQHEDTGTGQLVDKFHEKNRYIVARQGDTVVGMICLHNQPPFSVADRLEDQSILEGFENPYEIRLLTVNPDHRNGFVIGGLLWSVYLKAQELGASHMIISAVESSLPLYKQSGFEPLGPPKRQGAAMFTPMAASMNHIGTTKKRFLDLMLLKQQRQLKQKNKEAAAKFVPPEKEVCMLPGPVAIPESVHQAFHRPPIYHRGQDFIQLFDRVRQTLASLVNAREVALFNGSGTLANEVVGATLSAMKGSRGVILINGEFGERLEKQAKRFALKFRAITQEWGNSWNLDEVEKVISDLPDGSWIWGVHQESSTGVLNNLSGLASLVKQYGHRLCIDCISSVGATPIDLKDVFLASGTSGKSLGSYAGAAIVFANLDEDLKLDLSQVPSYLDLASALETSGPRYTFPSSTLCALEAALDSWSTPEKAQAKYQAYREIGAFIRSQLRELHIEPLAKEEDASPVVTTFAPPNGEKSPDFVTRCRSWGFALGGQSGYLAKRRLVQIATMGDLQTSQCSSLFNALRSWLAV